MKENYKKFPLPKGKEWFRLPERLKALEEKPAPAEFELPYKVYSALLTQYGSDEARTAISNGDLTIGVTYQIYDYGGAQDYDFTNVGAPNNNIETYFVATGTTPNSWGVGVGLAYVPAAPIVTVLENTIGNVWWTYNSVGGYWLNSDGLFLVDKTYAPSIIINNIPQIITVVTGNVNIIEFNNNEGDGTLNNTPIEIRVYN